MCCFWHYKYFLLFKNSNIKGGKNSNFFNRQTKACIKKHQKEGAHPIYIGIYTKQPKAGTKQIHC